MAQAPELGTEAKASCVCGGRLLRVLSVDVAVRVQKTEFSVLQYRHLKGCSEHNGHPQITSKRHLNEVCAMNNMHVERYMD